MFYHSLWQEELVKRVHEEGASIPKYLLSHLVKHFQRLVYVKNWYLKRSISDDSKSHIMLCFGKNPCWKSRFLINQWSMAFGDLRDIWTVIEYLRLFGERFHLDEGSVLFTAPFSPETPSILPADPISNVRPPGICSCRPESRAAGWKPTELGLRGLHWTYLVPHSISCMYIFHIYLYTCMCVQIHLRTPKELG